jgi:hypothetical protein
MIECVCGRLLKKMQRTRWTLEEEEGREKREEEEEDLFKAQTVNEADAERDRATPA